MYVQAGVYHGGPIKLELVYGDKYRSLPHDPSWHHC